MRLIDADELLTDPYFQDESIPEKDMFVEAVEDSPTIDAVEVVRCRDCLNRGMKASIKYYGYRDDMWLCMLHGIAILPDDYCSGGVKADVEVSGDD